MRALASAVLRRTSYFASCRADTIERFLKEGKVRLLRRGEVLARCGQDVDHMCLIVDGTLEMSMTGKSGKRHVVRYLEPGRMVNLVPLLDEQPAIHDATAHVDTVVLMLSRSLVLSVIHTEPGFALALMRLLCLRSRLTYLELADSTLLSLRERCARVLLHLAEPYGTPESGGVAISLKLSQDEFADMVGKSRPPVNRELKQLEREGLIRTTYSHFIILNIDALQKIVRGE